MREHCVRCWLHSVVVMPDHVHLILDPYEGIPLTTLVAQIKGRSAFLMNRSATRCGSVWQRDSFDHIVRADENLTKKIQYVCDNPVRKGLVTTCDEYRWLWRSWRDSTAG
ncbi:MAG: transposase [Acidobacteria bacterium]|nr:MAG: transposase [Acidobacteriota bacterium]